MACLAARGKKQGENSRVKASKATHQISKRRRKRVGDFSSMESLAYLHLELANQETEGEQNADSNNIGASWDAAGWDEIFDSINASEEEEEEAE
jgi:hypothetical protein